MDRVASVEVLEGHRVRLRLTSGSRREVDLGPYLRGPIFDEIRRDAAAFGQVRVDPALGTLVWPNGADICPDVLIQGRRPAPAPRPARTPRARPPKRARGGAR